MLYLRLCCSQLPWNSQFDTVEPAFKEWFLFISAQLDVLNMFDWENPDKLMRGREIDLSKSLPRESYLKMMAEQLTLMEFSVYASIQRK